MTTADVVDATPAGNAVHTSHRGAFTGVLDNTDVFFRLAQAAVRGVAAPAPAVPVRAVKRGR